MLAHQFDQLAAHPGGVGMLDQALLELGLGHLRGPRQHRLQVAEIAKLAAFEGADINHAKIALATAATALLHGDDAASAAEETAHRTFAEGASDENLPSLATGGEITIVAALTGLGFAASNGEARRKVAEGAVKLDGAPVTDPALVITVGDTPVKLSLGKKKHGLLTR